MNGHELSREAAIERLTDRRTFVSHLLTYLVVNTMLIVIWAVTGADYFWPIWPLLGWGIGVALHAWNLFGSRPITEADIRDEIQRSRH